MEEKYGKAPIFFLDETKQKEWDCLDDKLKKSIRENIHAYTEELSLEMSIQTLCHVYNELSERIDKLENK